MITEELERNGAFGAGNSIHAAELAKRLHLSRRELYDVCNSERRQGALLCAGHGGYYLPDSHDETAARLEVQRGIRRLRAQAKNELEVAAALEKAWEARSRDE